MQITMQGKYQTRDGRAVRILATDVKSGDASVIGLITCTDGIEFPECWRGNGKSLELGVTESWLDLVPVPARKPVVHQMWAVMEDGSDTIKYSSYCEQDAEWHCNVFLHETVRLIQWNT